MHIEKVSRSGSAQQVELDLGRYFNNRGLTRFGEAGGFNIWSNTYPAEELPPHGSAIEIDGVGFAFPAEAAGGDNIRCCGQRLEVRSGRYEWIYLLGAAERRTEDRVELSFTDGSSRHRWLRLSDFWPETPAYFGEVLAFRTGSLGYPRHRQPSHAPSIWQQRVAVGADRSLSQIRLPDNPAMHIFSMTIVGAE